MHTLAIALISARSFHTHHADRPDIPSGAMLKRLRFLIKMRQLINRLSQRQLPLGIRKGSHLHRQLNHLLFFELWPLNIDEQVADATVRCRRELNHETRVKAADRTRELLVRLPLFRAVCLMRFV